MLSLVEDLIRFLFVGLGVGFQSEGHIPTQKNPWGTSWAFDDALSDEYLTILQCDLVAVGTTAEWVVRKGPLVRGCSAHTDSLLGDDDESRRVDIHAANHNLDLFYIQ